MLCIMIQMVDLIEKGLILMLDEVVRENENLQTQIDALEKNVAELRQYYRVDKLENDNITLILGLVKDLVKRVEELERRIA